jgi:hypothetical protein
MYNLSTTHLIFVGGKHRRRKAVEESEYFFLKFFELSNNDIAPCIYVYFLTFSINSRERSLKQTKILTNIQQCSSERVGQLLIFLSEIVK